MQTRQFGVTEFENSDSSNFQRHGEDLIQRYDEISRLNRIDWSTNLRLQNEIGRGGQGTVYLAERTGADGFNLPVAAKIFSPEPYSNPNDYDQDMRRIGQIASRIARIENENLLNVYHFLNRDRIRIMIMEWIDGFDLRRLLTPRMLGLVQDRVSDKRWSYIQERLVSAGKIQPKLNACQAIHVLRDCLVALASLHECGIIHGDIKPANIMINRFGKAKLIDTGTASDEDFPARFRACTPAYSSPRVLLGESPSIASDLVSLGYILLELVCGRPIFSQAENLDQLIDEKRNILNSISNILPPETEHAEALIEICTALIANDGIQSSGNTIDSKLASADCFIQQIDRWELLVANPNDLRFWTQELLELPASEPEAPI